MAFILFGINTWAQCDINHEEFTLTINSTNSSDEIFWTVYSDSNEVYNFGFSPDSTTTFQESFCLPDGNFSFTLDQMSGISWTGSYSIVNSSNQVVASGASLNPLAPAQFMALGIHPCQEIQGSIQYNLPPDVGFSGLNSEDTISLCYDINLQVGLVFPENNTNYNQAPDNVTYLWEVSNPVGVSDGQTSTNNSVNFTFDDHLTYQVTLTVTDSNDCEWSQEFFVKNISPNTFLNVWVDDDTICVDELTNVHTNHYNTSFPLVISEPDPVFLDDTPGTGTIVEYTSTISINQFAAGDILDTNCISRVCATLEHSYVGDLSIYLELPNGQTIDFLTDHNGTGSGNGLSGGLFGVPNDIGGSPPQYGTGPDLEAGTPFRYCWTPIAANSMYNMGALSPFPETIINADGTYVNDYAWDDFNGNGWDNAIGASINGDWTIHIQDYFASDNGFIFGWDFELCESPQVVYVDSFWVGDPTTAFPNTFDADSVNREIIGVNTPTGVMDIEYHLIDNFGCEWVEELSIVTWENPEANDNAITFCTDTITIGVDDPNTTETGSWTYLAPPGGPQNVTFSPSADVLEPLVTVPELGEYHFIYTSACGSTDTQTVVFESQAPTLNIETSQVCDFEIALVATNPIQQGEWTATGPTGETIDIPNPTQATTTATVSNYGEYTFTYTYDICDASFSSSIDVISVKPIITNTESIIYCEKEIELNAIEEGQVDQWSVEGPGIVTFSAFENATTTANVSEYGEYTFYFEACGGRDTFDVVFSKSAPVLSAAQYVECGTEVLIEVGYVGDIGSWNVVSNTGQTITTTEVSDHLLSIESSDFGSVSITYNQCDTFATTEVVFMCELDIPNVFTPNNDPLNPLFIIPRLSEVYYDQSTFSVFNRWGVKVYENGQYGLQNNWWNGKESGNGEDLPEGVYFYELDVHNKVNNQNERYEGMINIFR